MRHRLSAIGLLVATFTAIGLGAPAASSQSLVSSNVSSTGAAGWTGPGTARPTASGSTTFRVPSPKCTSTPSAVQLGAAVIFGPNAVVSGAVVRVECQGGKAVYQGFLLAGNKQMVTTFHPASGDIIAVGVTQTTLPPPTPAEKASLVDVTKKLSASLISSAGYVSSGIVIEGAFVYSTLPVANVGTVSYTKSSEYGQTVPGSGAYAFDMVSSAKVLQIHTSPAVGGAFTETWKHS